MPISRLFRGKQPPPPQDEVKTPNIHELSGGYLQGRTQELYEKYKGDGGLDEDRKAQLDALAFVIHTLNAQEGISAQAKGLEYSYRDPKGLWFTLVVENGEAKCELKFKLYLYPYRAGPIMLDTHTFDRPQSYDLMTYDGRKQIYERSPSYDFMTYDGRKQIYDLLAAYMASNKSAQRTVRLRDGYYEQAQEGRKAPKPETPKP